MTRLDTRLTEFLRGELQGLSARKTLAHLLDRGLLDRRACEAEAIRAETQRLVRQGMPRCEAMELTAEQFNCSYGKVRGIIYERRGTSRIWAPVVPAPELAIPAPDGRFR